MSKDREAVVLDIVKPARARRRPFGVKTRKGTGTPSRTPLTVHALNNERLPHIFRAGINQLRTVRMAGRIEGAGRQPPVKRFAVMLRQKELIGEAAGR